MKDKIYKLLLSKNPSNIKLGIKLDDTSNGGKVIRHLNNKYAELMKLIEVDINELLMTNKINLCDMKLDELPEIPSWITSLDCEENNIKTLPDLPNIVTLFCGYNKLTNLPELPKCRILFCSSNKLTELPELPNIVELECFDNQLITLPELPMIRDLDCTNNKLTSLPSLSSSVSVYCDNYLK